MGGTGGASGSAPLSPLLGGAANMNTGAVPVSLPPVLRSDTLTTSMRVPLAQDAQVLWRRYGIAHTKDASANEVKTTEGATDAINRAYASLRRYTYLERASSSGDRGQGPDGGREHASGITTAALHGLLFAVEYPGGKERHATGETQRAASPTVTGKRKRGNPATPRPRGQRAKSRSKEGDVDVTNQEGSRSLVTGHAIWIFQVRSSDGLAADSAVMEQDLYADFFESEERAGSGRIPDENAGAERGAGREARLARGEALHTLAMFKGECCAPAARVEGNHWSDRSE